MNASVPTCSVESSGASHPNIDAMMLVKEMLVEELRKKMCTLPGPGDWEWATRRVILLSPQTVPYLHTIYTDQLFFPVAGPASGSAFFRPHPTNFIVRDVDLSAVSLVSVDERSIFESGRG